MAATERFRINLRAAIEKRGDTIKSFAEAAGMSRPHLTKLLNGHHSVTLENAERLAVKLGIDLKELLEPIRA